MKRTLGLTWLLVLGVSLGLGTGLGWAEKKEKGKLEKIDDRTFVLKASEVHLAEINLGRLAVTNAGAPEVKRFGQQMVDDHGKANDKLNQLASQWNLAVAATMGQEHRNLFNKLSALRGPEFDHLYINQMVLGHEQAIAFVQGAIDQLQNGDLKAYATEGLPHLKRHLKMAQDIRHQLARDREKVTTPPRSEED